MDRIPTEILQVICKFLDGPSLVACLQVSRVWQDTFLPLIWSTISVEDWINPDFPLRHWRSYSTINRSLQFVERVASYIRHIRSFTWHDNKTLATRGMYSELPRQITLFQLREISLFTPNLVRCSLAMTDFTPKDENLWTTLRILRKMPHLAELELELHREGCAKDIEEFFPLFSKLTELKIRGDWYRGAETLNPNPEEDIPWKLKNLEIDRIDKSFLPYCPHLEHFALNFNSSFAYQAANLSVFKDVVVEQLQGLLRLSTIVIRDYPYDSEGGIRHRLAKCQGDESKWSYPMLSDKGVVHPEFVTLQGLFSLP